MDECMMALSQKYQDNIVLLINNQRITRVPLSLSLKFKTYQDIKFEHEPNGRFRRRTSGQKLQAIDLYKDNLNQLE
jgi:hypothetical protein